MESINHGILYNYTTIRWKYEQNLTNNEKSGWFQLVHAIPQLWIKGLNEDSGFSVNVAFYDHNLIKNCQLCASYKFASNELYNISLTWTYEKPTPKSYYEKLSEIKNLNLKEIYILPRKVSIDRNPGVFQEKLF